MARIPAVDPAVARARAVVGLYGDPAVSWSIAVDVLLTSPLAAATLERRGAELVAAHPTLGAAPHVDTFSPPGSAATLARLLDTPYDGHASLLRIAASQDGSRLVLAAHHGAVDGLGLLAALGHLLDDDVASTAHGIGARAARVGFVRSSATRLVEAAFRPPARLAATAMATAADTISLAETAPGDVTARLDLALTAASTARSVTAAALVFEAWNRARGARSDRCVVAVGASRRDGNRATPDRDTAYLRLRLPSSATTQEVARLLAVTAPEPTFPERQVGRWAAPVRAALRNRLGSSLLVSNLGLVDGPTMIGRLAFYPAAAGPRAFAVGVASTASYTTVTVRLPRADFTTEAAAELCTAVAARLTQPAD